jgi:putative FmdB family regulatory protein
MPTYDWVCKVCKEAIETTMSYEDFKVPEHCGEEMNRSYSSPAIQFKGRGWAGK